MEREGEEAKGRWHGMRQVSIAGNIVACPERPKDRSEAHVRP